MPRRSQNFRNSAKTHFAYDKLNKFSKTLCYLILAEVNAPVIAPPPTHETFGQDHCPTCSRNLQNQRRRTQRATAPVPATNHPNPGGSPA